MNERIEKLYGQSFVNENYVNVGPNGTELVIRFYPEKFAELIVRECIEQVFYTIEDEEEDNISGSIRDRIKQHFGVLI